VTVPAAPAAPQRADLVLEGGGVRGVALVGAVAELAEAGWTFPRVAGSSAGAVVGAVVAALQAAGEPVSRVVELARELDYRALRDGWRFGPPGLALNLLLSEGLHTGRPLRRYLAGQLADLGVRTFGDLCLPDDPGTDLAPGRRYRLVVTATDVSRGRLALLPWDVGEAYGRDPDDLAVVEAVAASAAIPFYFQPVRLPTASGTPATLVDGSVLSGFPIAVFDRQDGRDPRWPTFGIRLSASDDDVVRPVRDPVTLLVRLVDTVLEAGDRRRADLPDVRRRTIFVDTAGTGLVEFDISRAEREVLVERGRRAAASFLAGWDLARYVADARRG
jgi:NTE family protein